MAIEFKLPEVSEGVESADIAEILVSEGDVIEADQVVMEVETEKAVVELPCPHAGKITKIHVSEGDSVDVGAVLLSIEVSEPAEKAEPAPADQGGEEKSDKEPQPKKTDKEPETSRGRQTGRTGAGDGPRRLAGHGQGAGRAWRSRPGRRHRSHAALWFGGKSRSAPRRPRPHRPGGWRGNSTSI